MQAQIKLLWQTAVGFGQFQSPDRWRQALSLNLEACTLLPFAGSNSVPNFPVSVGDSLSADHQQEMAYDDRATSHILQSMMSLGLRRPQFQHISVTGATDASP